MELSLNDNLQQPTISSNDVDHHHDNNNMPVDVANPGEMEYKQEIGEEEAKNILEVIASTGKFWNDWDKLKSLLSFQLKQVLSEYPEAKTTSELQISLLGETYLELVQRLDEALRSFTEGPPFTLQRLCEILLTARTIYPNLSKLALALEKNLLVTSTLTISTDPYPAAIMQKPEEIDGSEEPPLPSHSVQNGVENVTSEKDEAMTEAEPDANEEMAIGMESFEMAGPSEPNSAPATVS
ncbi:hypothetical protein NMG60_11013883 [Bertholletia excelsa]